MGSDAVAYIITLEGFYDLRHVADVPTQSIDRGTQKTIKWPRSSPNKRHQLLQAMKSEERCS
jgi:hypothetical protein